MNPIRKSHVRQVDWYGEFCAVKVSRDFSRNEVTTADPLLQEVCLLLGGKSVTGFRSQTASQNHFEPQADILKISLRRLFFSFQAETTDSDHSAMECTDLAASIFHRKCKATTKKRK